MAEQKIYTLTIDGKVKLERELKRIKEEDRPRVLDALKEARAQGDLSENADYDAARDEQARIEQRITEIEQILKNHQLISERKFSVLFVEENKTETIYLVGAQEIDPLKNKISIESPLGKILNEASLNKPLKVKTDNNEFTVIVKAIA